jgi:hypothetical protein
MAVQAVAETQETPCITPASEPLGSGLVWVAHEVPFHRSTRILEGFPVTIFSPTAVQAVEDVQETSSSCPVAVAGVCNVHAEPFQNSTSVRHSPELFSYQPTAVHAVLEVQDTPFTELDFAPLGTAMDWMAQAVPFHRMANGRLPVPPV